MIGYYYIYSWKTLHQPHLPRGNQADTLVVNQDISEETAINDPIFSSPGKYVQGRGVLDALGKYLSPLGDKALLIADDIVWEITGQRVKTSLEHADHIRFYRLINMPAALKDIQLEKESFANLVKIGALACAEGDTPRNLNVALTAEEVAHDLIAVDAFSRTVSN